MSAPDDRPQFCPWCGTPVDYEHHRHTPRYEVLAEKARAEGVDLPQLPPRVRDMLAGDGFVTSCRGCRTISHVVVHRAH